MSFLEKKRKRQITIGVSDVTSTMATVEWEAPVSVLKKDVETYIVRIEANISA